MRNQAWLEQLFETIWRQHSHDYYEKVRIIGMEPAVADGMLFFLKKFCLAMDKYFDLIGIEPKEQM